MKDKTYWTDWDSNPFKVAMIIAQRQNCVDELNSEILKIVRWINFDDEYFLDDVLQEIAMAANIVVQYDTTNKQFRAAWDGA